MAPFIFQLRDLAEAVDTFTVFISRVPKTIQHVSYASHHAQADGQFEEQGRTQMKPFGKWQPQHMAEIHICKEASFDDGAQGAADDGQQNARSD